MVREGDLRAGIAPVGQLGNSDKNVKMNLIHNISFAEAKEQWERRKERINYNNLFVKMGFENSEKNCEKWIDAFNSLDHKKVLFYNGEKEVDRSFKTERFYWRQSKLSRVQQYSYNDFVRASYYWEMDILKLLTGDDHYSRESYKTDSGILTSRA